MSIHRDAFIDSELFQCILRARVTFESKSAIIKQVDLSKVKFFPYSFLFNAMLSGNIFH